MPLILATTRSSWPEAAVAIALLAFCAFFAWLILGTPSSRRSGR